MTKGPWKYEKSGTHFHVIMSDDETLDVCSKEDALIISQVPEFVKLMKLVSKTKLLDAWKLAKEIERKLQKHANAK